MTKHFNFPHNVVGFFLAAIALAIIASSAEALEPGANAPDFRVQTISSTPLTLAEFKGKVVYLDFWASWCGPCKHTLPWMNALQEKYGSQGFQVIAISVDTELKDATKALADISPSYLVGVDTDGAIAAAYEPPKMPSSYLIGRDGKVLRIFAGFHEGDQSAVAEAIQLATSKE